MKTPENAWEEHLHTQANPLLFPVLKHFSRKPMSSIPGLGTVVSDSGLIREILNNKEAFTKTGKRGPANLWTPLMGDKALINMDGKEHIALRKKLGPLFSPRYLKTFSEGIMQEPLDNMVSDLNAGKNVDVAQVSLDIAGRMICSMTGLDSADENIKKSVVQAKEITKYASINGKMSQKKVLEGRKVLSSLVKPIEESYNSTAETSTLPQRLKECGLTLEETVGVCSTFIIAGTETISTFIPRLVALMGNKNLRKYASASSEERKNFINEGLRIVVPTPVMLRNVTEDIVFHGKKLSKDSRVIISTVFACRKVDRGSIYDPTQEIPDEMRNIWFGAGSHFCIGMPLAMIQIESFLEALTSIYSQGELKVVKRLADKEAFTATYKNFVIKLEKHENNV